MMAKISSIFSALGSGFKSILPVMAGALAIFAGLFIKKVADQKQRNTLNEIDNTAEKTSLDVHAEPTDDLVSASNKSHGADDVVKTTGDDPKKG